MVLFKSACRIYLDHAIHRYLMSNADGRWNGAEKSHWHQEMCRFYVAVVRGCLPGEARERFDADYQSVHLHTQKLTDNLDEAIGFPLKGMPDYDALAPLFFEQFHSLALEALTWPNGAGHLG